MGKVTDGQSVGREGALGQSVARFRFLPVSEPQRAWVSAPLLHQTFSDSGGLAVLAFKTCSTGDIVDLPMGVRIWTQTMLHNSYLRLDSRRFSKLIIQCHRSNVSRLTPGTQHLTVWSSLLLRIREPNRITQPYRPTKPLPWKGRAVDLKIECSFPISNLWALSSCKHPIPCPK
jgi:hypothetical protein